MVSLGLYIKTMSQSNPSACCGFISATRNSSDGYVPGAECYTREITGNAIDHVNDSDGNIWCSVNGVICDGKTLDNGQNTTLGQCFNESGYNVSSLCSAEALSVQSENQYVTIVVVAGALMLLIVVSTLRTIFDVFGICQCTVTNKFESIECCQSKKCEARWMMFNMILTFVSFFALWMISLIFIDEILDDGYSLLAGSNLNTVTEAIYGDTSYDDIANEIDETCDINGFSFSDGFIWVNYDMEIPGYLLSDFADGVSLCGMILTFIELYIVMKLHDLLKKEIEKEEKKKGKGTADVELGTR